jgi:hypothetical protein
MTNRRSATLARPARERRPAGNAALIAAELSVVRCRWCNDDLEHCHASLVTHASGDVHCMSAECTTPPELHHMIVDCGEFACGCAGAVMLDSAAAGLGA